MRIPAAPHCPLDELVADKSKALAWMKKITDRGLEISALSCHGNPIHPDAAIAKEHDAISARPSTSPIYWA